MLFIKAARRLPKHRFVIGGSLYPETFPWAANIRFISHIPPARHCAFYCSSIIDAECDARRDGRKGLVSVRPSVRS
jgi:hypothetical protein